MNAHDAIQAVLRRHGNDGTRLMQILRETQEVLGWLSPETLSDIAAGIGWPRAQVEGTASFYRFFHTQPLGQYRVLWSNNITDRMLGSRDLMLAMCRLLWVERGRVSEDGLVSVDATSCTGLSDQGPAVLVNYRAVRWMTMDRVEAMVELIRKRTPLADWPADWFRIEDNIRRRDILLNHGLKAGTALAATQARGPEATLSEIRASLLRGRGGAGYVTADKWQACRNAHGKTRIIICNADEGEPGTFKDRVLLNTCADLVFEGMTIAALVVGASQGYVYLRGEYRHLLEPLNSALARRRQAGLLGDNILRHGLFFRHRNPSGRRRLHLRRGIGAHRIARRQARHSAQPTTLPRNAGLSRPANGGGQRRNPRRRRARRNTWRRMVSQPRHASIDRHQAAVSRRRLRATGYLRIPLRC